VSATGFALFDTPIGRCGIAWTAQGLVAVQLPEASEARTRARLQRRLPGASEATPPGAVQRAADAIAALLRGEASDLSAIALDMEGVPPFHRRVYEAARAIPRGSTLSYGEIAARIGAPGTAPAVGQALGRNPFSIVVPCHRVLAAGGRLGGFSASGGVATKVRLLALEAPPAQESLPLGAAEAAPGIDAAAALAHLRAADPALARLIDAVGPFELRLQPTPSVFLALAEAIVHQQLSGKAAQTIFARLRAQFPHPQRGPSAEQILRASDARLRAAGLSQAKLLSLRDLARRACDGELPTLAELRRMEDDAIVERLTAVRGVGRWTVEMLLIFRLGRPDVLPVDDYGVRKGLALALRRRVVPGAKDLAARGERWQPWRTVASWYLWRALELPRA
jgi:methylated-DNA-[protein]-cysteine S-methyltransferase